MKRKESISIFKKKGGREEIPKHRKTKEDDLHAVWTGYFNNRQPTRESATLSSNACRSWLWSASSSARSTSEFWRSDALSDRRFSTRACTHCFMRRRMKVKERRHCILLAPKKKNCRFFFFFGKEKCNSRRNRILHSRNCLIPFKKKTACKSRRHTGIFPARKLSFLFHK